MKVAVLKSIIEKPRKLVVSDALHISNMLLVIVYYSRLLLSKCCSDDVARP